MKLLVTGGAGFIGSNFITYWLNKHPKDEIINLDLLTYAGNPANLVSVAGAPNYVFIKGDIGDPTLVDQLVAQVDVIVHFAAETHVDRSIVGPEAFIRTNVLGTQVLLEAARKHGKRFHHISTDEVFGALELSDTKQFTEDTPYQPHSPYAASKAASDHVVRAYADTYGVPVTITNCSNNFGPYQHPEKFIARMITNLLDGGNAKIYGDGLYVRDWLHVEDHCRAIEAVLEGGKIGETYLVGGQPSLKLRPAGMAKVEYNNLEIAHMLVEYVTGRPAKTAGDPQERIEYVKDRPGHDRRYAVDWGKINRELGWKPEHSFAEWLKQTVEWYRANESWWRPLKQDAEKIYANEKIEAGAKV